MHRGRGGPHVGGGGWSRSTAAIDLIRLRAYGRPITWLLSRPLRVGGASSFELVGSTGRAGLSTLNRPRNGLRERQRSETCPPSSGMTGSVRTSPVGAAP